MRVVLLSTLEPAAGAGVPRGFLRLGGRPLVEHQLAAAVSLGCEKAYCLADGFPRELIALQALAEAAGVSFRVVASGHDLARLVSPTDDVLVFLDGLVPSLGQLAAVSETGTGVTVIPADLGNGGFERIDLNHAWSGFMRIPGVLLLRLSELPSDWNAPSTLLRVAGQAELPQRPLPRAAVTEGQWTLLRTEADAERFEPTWLRLQTSHRARHSPGCWLAAQFLRRLGPVFLNAGLRGVVLTLVAIILGLLGLGAAWVGIHAGGFLLIGLAWLAQESAGLLGLVDGGAGWRRRASGLAGAMPWFIDGLLAIVCMSRLAAGDSFALHPLQASIIALTLIGVLRLVGELAAGRRLANWIEDRFAMALLLAAASFVAPFSVLVMAASLTLVVVALVLASIAGKTVMAGKRPA